MRRIDDHSFWAGGSSKASIFPEGVKTKSFSSAEGAGELRRYEETSDEIQRAQEMAERKVKSHPRKDFEKN